MTTNEQTIHRFYSAFQKLDYTTMQSCYHPEAIFNDPVFGLLDAEDTKLMWEMLCKRAKDFSLVYSDIQILDEEYTTTQWMATYTFGKTGRRVVNRIKAHMKFKDGLIIEHTDAFDLYRWSRQAIGIMGFLMGWTNFFQNKIRKQARIGFDAYKKGVR
jgi:hypothetical protein